MNEISEILKKNMKSISGISQELRKRGYDSHRLILTGYLRALRDMGVLKEISKPPSKLYSPISAEELFFSRFNSLAERVKKEDLMPALIVLVNSILERECTIGDVRRAGIPQEVIKKLIDMNVIRENGGTYILIDKNPEFLKTAIDIAGKLFTSMLLI